MSLKGDGKPVSFIEGLRGAAGAPGRVHRRADPGVRQKHGTAAPGTRMPRWARCTCGPILDMRDGRRRRRRCAPSPRKRRRWCASTGRLQRRARRRPVPRRMDPLAVRARRSTRLPRHQAAPGSGATSSTPARSSTRRRWTSAADPLIRRATADIPLTPALDWSAWNVQNDPVTEQTTAPGTGGDVTGGFAKAVEMCNNNGHCRKFDAGTMCPSYRVTRDEQHLTRGRANTLRLALSGQLGGETRTATRSRRRWICASPARGCQARLPTGVDMARATLSCATRLALYRADAEQALAASKAVVLWIDTFNGHFETEMARRGSRCRRRASYAVHEMPGLEGEPGAAAAAARQRAWSRAKALGWGALATALCPLAQGIADRRPGAFLPAQPARRVLGMGLGEAAQARADPHLRGSSSPARPCRTLRAAIEPAWTGRSGAWPLPPEGLRRDAAGAGVLKLIRARSRS